jgi:glutathione S-transferase
MITIWGRTNSVNVQKVMWALAELGLAHRRHDAGGKFGGLEAPDYLARNPNSRIPTIDDNGVIVWESNVIVRYLAARYGSGTLWPSDPAARAAADQWMDWQQTTIGPDLGPVFMGLVRTPPEQRDMKAIAAAAERVGKSWGVLDRHLAGRDFVAGERFTMGDIPVGALYWRYVNLPVARPALPECDAWHKRLQARAAFREHVALPLT